MEKMTQDQMSELGTIVADKALSAVKPAIDGITADVSTLKDEVATLKGSLKSTDAMNSEVTRKKVIVDAFNLIKSGKTDNLTDAIDLAYMNEGTSGEGKELVMAEFANEIYKKMSEFAVIDNKRTYTTGSNEFNIRTYANGANTAYVATGTAPDVSKGSTDVVTVKVADAVTYVKVEDNLDSDVTEAYNLIVADIGESQAKFVETQTLVGDGTGLNRLGVFNNTEIVEVDNAETSLAALTATEMDDLLDAMIVALDAAHENGAKFYFTKYVLGLLKKLRTSTGAKMYPELDVKASERTLKGYPVVIVADADITNSTNDATGTRGILLGNFSRYAEVSRKSVEVRKVKVADDELKRLSTVLATARHSGTVLDATAFVVSVNA